MPAQRFDDVTFLNSPALWPNWPVCPVKRYDQCPGMMPTCGLVFDLAGCKPAVYLLNMWELSTPGSVENAAKQEFESFAELVAAGWMVD